MGWGARARLAGVIGVLAMGFVPRQGAADGWFVPPPEGHGPAGTVDMTRTGDPENVTVIARRVDRSWRSKVGAGHLNDPRASDAARPQHDFVAPTPYCNSALRTVGGQPASAGELQVGAGAGGC